jgi:hypothetical protein
MAELIRSRSVADASRFPLTHCIRIHTVRERTGFAYKHCLPATWEAD